jgi:hypothetical protein
MIEFADNLFAVCLTLGLRSQELSQPKLCLRHIKSLALTLGNDDCPSSGDPPRS